MKKKTLQQKLATHFGVKIAEGGVTIKHVNPDERTIEAVANTYYLIDSDFDMLVAGCAVKSINDRGPQSSATAKIKHQSDHVLNTKNTVGRITVLDERMVEGNTVLYFESYIPETRKGLDDLINYQENVYDNHSIGFRYKQIEIADPNGSQMEQANWAEFYPLAINPEKADELGFFWVVKEIELFEISVVSYGANKLTPFLGSKSKEDNDRVKADLFERIDLLKAQLKSNADAGKDERKTIDLEFSQLKQIITELELVEPSKKDTSEGKPSNKDTDNEDSKTVKFKKSIIKNL